MSFITEGFFNIIGVPPRTAISTRAEATTRLVILFEKADEILKNRLDALAKTLELENKNFYLQYQSARIIIDLGIRTEVQNKANND